MLIQLSDSNIYGSSVSTLQFAEKEKERERETSGVKQKQIVNKSSADKV